MSDGADVGTKEFRIKEFEALRKEIEERTKDQWTIERDIIIATFGIFWALATLKELPDYLKPIFWFLWWLPLVVLIAGGGRWWEDHRMIKEIGKFIEAREKILDPPEGGWENSSVTVKARLRNYIPHILSWILLFAFDIAVPIYIKCHKI